MFTLPLFRAYPRRSRSDVFLYHEMISPVSVSIIMFVFVFTTPPFLFFLRQYMLL